MITPKMVDDIGSKYGSAVVFSGVKSNPIDTSIRIRLSHENVERDYNEITLHGEEIWLGRG